MRRLVALALLSSVAGCASGNPIRLADHEYEVVSFEGKEALYARLEQFCVNKGGRFEENYVYGATYKFFCLPPGWATRPKYFDPERTVTVLPF